MKKRKKKKMTMSLHQLLHQDLSIQNQSTLVLWLNPLLHQQHQIKKSHHLPLKMPILVLCIETQIDKGKNPR
ncbi:p21 (RAC1) activated kinase 3 [Phyllostomus discolor]|uniref:p21 (RAC1) activated kinase 3 n=1 Tax=Phyllostomus discolor TaxID=89673 RepID=A0A834DRY6_9CHIR|nr:p21 (RAC1) activated kinase 3 [Phyllostomus discolor]